MRPHSHWSPRSAAAVALLLVVGLTGPARAGPEEIWRELEPSVRVLREAGPETVFGKRPVVLLEAEGQFHEWSARAADGARAPFADTLAAACDLRLPLRSAIPTPGTLRVSWEPKPARKRNDVLIRIEIREPEKDEFTAVPGPETYVEGGTAVRLHVRPPRVRTLSRTVYVEAAWRLRVAFTADEPQGEPEPDPQPDPQPVPVPDEFPVVSAAQQDILLGGSLMEAKTKSLQARGSRSVEFAWGEGGWLHALRTDTGLEHQHLHTSRVWPRAQIEQAWREGREITEVGYGPDGWVVLSSKQRHKSGQSWVTHQAFPKAEIRQRWDKGQRIQHVAFGGGVWSVVLARETGYESQAYIFEAQWPAKEIKKYWDEDFHITTAAYGQGHWAVVMSTGTGYDRQAYFHDQAVPGPKIAAAWRRGEFVTCLAAGAGQWLVVVSELPRRKR